MPWHVVEEDSVANARQIAEIIQKVYLGVGIVVSADEARTIANQAGAGLVGSLPVEPAPQVVA